jgi:hypothetical protein
MTPYIISGIGDKSPLYSLYAVVVHLDIMNAAFSGHYVCYVKNFNGEWFRIDDSTVSSCLFLVSVEILLSLAPGFLLYTSFLFFSFLSLFFFFLKRKKLNLLHFDLENKLLQVY